MGTTALNIQNKAAHDVEIVLHIDETMVEEERSDLARHLEEGLGINSVSFCNNRFHLMLVNYDRNRMTSQDVLGRVTDRELHAVLIGPV